MKYMIRRKFYVPTNEVARDYERKYYFGSGLEVPKPLLPSNIITLREYELEDIDATIPNTGEDHSDG